MPISLGTTPQHRFDQHEEQSLFPRLRASQDPAAHRALAHVQSLAAKVLNHRQLEEVGQEMAKRRGLAVPQSQR
jgi:hypothetical protein